MESLTLEELIQKGNPQCGDMANEAHSSWTVCDPKRKSRLPRCSAKIVEWLEREFAFELKEIPFGGNSSVFIWGWVCLLGAHAELPPRGLGQLERRQLCGRRDVLPLDPEICCSCQLHFAVGPLA